MFQTRNSKEDGVDEVDKGPRRVRECLRVKENRCECLDVVNRGEIRDRLNK